MKSKLPGAWQLLKGSITQFGRHWKLFVPMGLIVAAPASLISVTQGTNPETAIAAYAAFANLVMYLALMWLVMELEAGRPVGIKAAYYEGSAAMVKFILTALLLTFELLPLVVGVQVYLLGTDSNTVSVSSGEKVLLGFIWLIFALPSLYLLCRSIFSLFIVQDPAMTPVKALRASWQATKRRSWAVARRLLVLAGFGIVFLVIPVLGLLAKSGADQPTVIVALLQTLSSVVVLPISFIFIYRLYLVLGDRG